MVNHSFAVIAYKESPYLESCLDSLKAQSVNSNIFITTSTPSDYISRVAIKYGLEVYVTSFGKGIAHDWSFGLQQAKTKYVTLAHQDDLYLPNYTEDCLKACEKFSDTLICFTGYTEIFEHKERTNTLLLNVKSLMLGFFTIFKNDIRKQFWRKLLISTGNPIAAPSVMYNLDCVAEFQFSKEFSINMDWEAWFRMSQMNGRFVYIPKVLMKHRIYKESTTSEGLKSNLRQQEDIEMFRYFWPKPVANILAKIYAISYRSNNG